MGNKYRAQKTIVDGITFDSKAEARRYQELKLLEKAGRIENLTLQPSFDLHVNGKKIGRYVADFYYTITHGPKNQNIPYYEDVKGVKTPLYRWKKKHVEAEYGITITEVTA